MNGGTNGQSASGAAAWSCLVRSFRRVILASEAPVVQGAP